MSSLISVTVNTGSESIT